MLPILRQFHIRPSANIGSSNGLERILDEFWPMEVTSQRNYGKVDLYEDENNLYLEAELPGISRDEVQVTLEDGILHLEAEHKVENEKKETNYFIRERTGNKWSRRVHLPISVDQENVEATYKDGILKIRLPKMEKNKTHKIKVK